MPSLMRRTPFEVDQDPSSGGSGNPTTGRATRALHGAVAEIRLINEVTEFAAA